MFCKGPFWGANLRREICLQTYSWKVLPYMAYMGMCCWTGYGFSPLCPKQGNIILCESVSRVCLNDWFKVARYSFSGSTPPKFEHKLRRHKQRFGKIATQYTYYIKMTICDDQGCNDIGVVIETKWRHYLFYLRQYFLALGTVLPKLFTGSFSCNRRLDWMFMKFKQNL